MPQDSRNLKSEQQFFDVCPPLTLNVKAESLPLSRPFSISRGSKSAAEVILVHIEGAGFSGYGEAVPYARFGETVKDCLMQVQALRPSFAQGLCHTEIAHLLPAGAARNAVDCALWDWKAKFCKKSVADIIGLSIPDKVVTAFTIGLGQPSHMADQAAQASHFPLLKLKLGDAPNDAERLKAIRAAAPDSRLIVDANEGWSIEDLTRLAPIAKNLNIELIEQPLPADRDDALLNYTSPVPLCADESFQGGRRLEDLARIYKIVNIKLDKTGGLSEALELTQKARNLNIDIFLGCMVASSLAMVPALHLASLARWVDLDGPLFLAADRAPGLNFHDGCITYMPQGLWGDASRLQTD